MKTKTTNSKFHKKIQFHLTIRKYTKQLFLLSLLGITLTSCQQKTPMPVQKMPAKKVKGQTLQTVQQDSTKRTRNSKSRWIVREVSKSIAREFTNGISNTKSKNYTNIKEPKGGKKGFFSFSSGSRSGG